MIPVFCMDNNGGTSFAGRRQSRDKRVYEDILSQCKGSKLYIGESSLDLFADFQKNGAEINVVHAPTALCDCEAEAGDYCFSELEAPEAFARLIDGASKIIVYKWNRDYPYDEQADIDFEGSWILESSEDFVGNSHEKITRETYNRR